MLEYWEFCDWNIYDYRPINVRTCSFYLILIHGEAIS